MATADEMESRTACSSRQEQPPVGTHIEWREAASESAAEDRQQLPHFDWVQLADGKHLQIRG